jgi:hypothetical protein
MARPVQAPDRGADYLTMDTSSIELWRIGSVVCYWSDDFRQVRVLRNGMLVSDQTFPYPADALEAAREMRLYFRLMAELERGETPKVSTAASRRSHARLRPVHTGR